MKPNRLAGRDAALLNGKSSDPKFKSVRRAFRMLDVVSARGDGLTAKELAREVGTNLSSCYYLLNILIEEGYVEKVPSHGGYRIGPTVSVLQGASRSRFDARVEPVGRVRHRPLVGQHQQLRPGRSHQQLRPGHGAGLGPADASRGGDRHARRFGAAPSARRCR